MTQVAYLLDEHVGPSVLRALAGIEPSISARLIGRDDDAPPKRTPDPDVLAFAEREGLAVVTFDKRTMPRHVLDHLAAGRHTWGVFLFPQGEYLSAGRIAEELVLVWATSAPHEWVDRIEYLPY